MPYATRTTIGAPSAMYDTVHARILAATGGAVDGLMVHLARPTAAGFEVLEVWQSREHCDSFTRDVVGPLLAEVTAAHTGPHGAALERHFEEFALRGLVIPAANVAV